MTWLFTIFGIVLFLGMSALVLVGVHMMIQPQIYVGRGPIPARDARNVRAMGVLFSILGGTFTTMFTLPLLLLSYDL